MLYVEKIEKAFGTNKVLNGISFAVGDGEIYGLIGKNGAGKTTLMSIIAGLSKPDNGRCSIANMGNSKINIGYLPDIPAFFDYLTTQEYLAFLLRNKNSNRVSQLLQLVGLKGNERIKAMSRGMKQRLGIAAAIVTDPAVLLLDEPTSALDPQGRHELMEILKELKTEGHSIVLSTHILADMENVCDKVGFLHDGVIKKEIEIVDLLVGEQGAWEISFEKPIEIMPYDETAMSISKIGENRFLFEAINQKYTLQYLSQLPVKIVSIRNKILSLDDLFEEVCKCSK